jgi:hypothetical protein
LVALDLAVVARGAGLDRVVADLVGGEQLGERAVLGVGEVVVGLDAPRLDPELPEEAQRALQKPVIVWARSSWWSSVNATLVWSSMIEWANS